MNINDLRAASVRVVAMGLASAVALLGVTGAAAQDAGVDEDKVFYYLGTAVGRNLKTFEMSDDEVDEVIKGIRETMAGKQEQLNDELYSQRLNELSMERMQVAAAREAEESLEYLESMAKEDGAQRSDTGVIYLETRAGDGAQPLKTSTVIAHYKGTLRDGTVFDNSYDRGQPLTIPLSQVIPCWTEAIAKMKVGGAAKITCPSEMAYGDRATGSIPPGSALTFEVELLEVVQGSQP